MGATGQAVQVRLLGAVEVVVDGRSVEIGSAKQLCLFTALALEAGTVLPAERLADVLWGEDLPETAQPTLRGLVARLRRVLAADGEEPVEWLRGKGAGYVLDVPPEQVDRTRFDRLAAAGRDALARSAPAEAVHSLCEALALWRGPALDGLVDSTFLAAVARRLDGARLDVTEDLADAELGLGRPGDALARLESHVASNPLRERAWGQLMLALYRLGRQADALAAYQRVRQILADELGVDPTPALRELESRILAHDPALTPAASAPTPLPGRDFGDTVAFLFTDIESSTRRWEGDSEAMAADLARHDKLLTDTCEAWGGSVFNHTGDGLCAAFPTAAAALGAAVAGQGALAAERWERDRSLRARMAVHAGAAERRAGNYFGPTLNRAARLLSAAWGGQIVCSAAAADLAADQLPDQIGLRDLGEARLADLARPERVFQVTHPALPADFPSLRAADAPRSNLPAAVSTFVGRTAEISEIVERLAASRLVTLLGPGGAGKTRLSLEAAAAVLERFGDGVWFVELAPLRDPALVAHEVAAAIGLDAGALAASGRPFLASLCDQLRRRRLLVVLDNCEHLVAAAAEVAHAILSHCPDVSVLASSREVLAVAGETIVRIGPLSLPADDGAGDGSGSDAVTLFCERAQESSAGFRLTAANAAAVARICRRLDGSPLALELAAARIRLLGAEALVERLDDRFRLLAGGPRTADPRHQSMQAAVDWSHDLLSEAERVVLRRLSVFPSDFSLAAAEAVTAGGAELEGPDGFEVLDIVGRLADKSLLTIVAEDASEVRYRPLETVRQYAAGKLADAGETAAAQERHRDFFSPGAAWLAEGATIRMLRWSQAEADNLRAALERAWDAGDGEAILRLATPQYVYWMLCGAPDAVEWLERAVAAPGTGDVALRVYARCGLGMVLQNVGGAQTDRCVPLLRDAVALAVEHCDETVPWAQLLLGQLLTGQGQLDEAESLYLDALEAVRTRADRCVEAHLLSMLAVISMVRGELGKARAGFEHAVVLLGAGTSNYMQPYSLSMLALLDAVAGDTDQARDHAARAVEVCRQIPGRQVLVMGLVRAAETAMITASPDSARASLDELLGLLRELGSPRWVAEALELTSIVLGPDRPEAAARLLGSAVALRGSLREEGGFLAVLGERLACCSAEVAAALGPAAAEQQSFGAAMHLDEVLAYARSELQAVGT